MKNSYATKMSITLPQPLEKELKVLAKKEHRTLSGVIQEAARYYLNLRRLDNIQNKLSKVASRLNIYSEEDVDSLIHEMRSQR